MPEKSVLMKYLQVLPLLLIVLFNIVLFNMASAAEPFVFAEDKDKKQLTLSEGTMPVFTYQYDVIEHDNVPRNNPRRTSGCYVHPLYGLNGEILTDNAPGDHYHHHGIFWRWSHVGLHEPDGTTTEHSLWENNTGLKQHFVQWLGGNNITEESAAFTVENGWFIGDPKEGKKIMRERVKIIAHRIQMVGDVRSRAVDFEFQWQLTDKPITLRGVDGKSYGGFTMRFQPFVPERRTLASRSEINRITVPTGIAPGDLEETPLPWAGYTSHFPRRVFDADVRMQGQPVEGAVVTVIPHEHDQPSGAVIFIPKEHPDFPPTWLTRYYGPLCVGWPGAKVRTFQPGETLELRYRIWIHDGAVTVPQIEEAYEEYNRSVP